MNLARWEVFKQDTESKPHQAVGSVHAADAEGALLNARHVFARRPSAVSLWVAPASRIFTWTAEEILALRPAADEQEAEADDQAAADTGPAGTYLVFRKTSNRRSMTFVDHVGEVRADGPRAALSAALQQFNDVEVLAWWLLPQDALGASAAQDAESWFEPARDKTYKQQSAYGRIRPTNKPANKPASKQTANPKAKQAVDER